MKLLQAENLSMRFAGLAALDDVSFDVEAGEIVGLIGPNGAGKSTCFNVISGVLRASGGRLRYRGDDIIADKPHQIAQRGLVRTFQNTSVFMDLNVRENVRAACYLQARTGLGATLGALLHSRSFRKDEAAIDVAVQDILVRVGLLHAADTIAASLPYGSLRKLGIAIALAARPQLLLMDEPAAGLNPTESAEFSALTRRIRGSGVTVLLVEHDMKVIMGLCDRIVVLNYGKKLAEGKPEAIRNNPDVIASYLGTRHKVAIKRPEAEA